ncbi:MAG: cytochrome c peroxidase [Bacteroidota bacterium]
MIIRFNNQGAYWVSLLVLVLAGCGTPDAPRKEADDNPFATLQVRYGEHLRTTMGWLDSMQVHEGEALAQDFLLARDEFKRMEAILAFMDHNTHGKLNGPNLLKVEEEDLTDIKKIKPTGFQVMEELLFAEEQPDVAEIRAHAKKSRDRLNLLASNLDLSRQEPYHFLWLLRGAIVRIALNGITGFDSPALARSLVEADIEYTQLSELVPLFAGQFDDPELLEAWTNEFATTRQALQSSDFDTFDRYAFIRQHTHTQLDLWNQTVADWQVEFPITMALSNEAPSLFSANTFNTDFFRTYRNLGIGTEYVALGKALFNDTNLSESGTMACATCHQAELAFTDGLQKSAGQTRNSPTLTYAGLQQAFFADNRSGSLEGQIIAVVNSETEFHSDLQGLAQVVSQEAEYTAAFDSLYREGITDTNIRHAIAEYIRSLAPFSSKFDRNIRGEEETLTSLEIEGFNLFMGKAACATCHFAPLFNGTVPGRCAESEMEHLGTPSMSVTANALIDPDLGRYNLMETEERRHFFKTPTVRNVALTAPYMHNGVYATLEEVVDFYNRGGGWGIGIEEEYQTLPPDPLGLTDHEQEALVAFLHTLTDARFE